MANKDTRMNKEQVVAELEQKLKCTSVVLVDFTGLNVEQVTQLRNNLRKVGVDYKVVKNTLTNFAAKNCGFNELEPYLSGPTAIAVSADDAVAPAKGIIDGAKQFENLRVKVGIVEGKIINAEQVKEIANLPSKPVMIAKVLGGFMAPMSNFVNVLNANIRGLVVALNAVAKQKAVSEKN